MNFYKFTKWLFIGIMCFCLGMVLADLADAKDFKVPKDAVIKVYTKDGKLIGKMSRAKYKVVKLGTNCTKTKVVTKTKTKVIKKNICKSKNRIKYSIGAGKHGLTRKYRDGSHVVEDRTTPVVGFGYSRKVDDVLSIGGTIHTNQTTTLDLGIDF